MGVISSNNKDLSVVSDVRTPILAGGWEIKQGSSTPIEEVGGGSSRMES